jgi:gamma-glutamylcyclotransferase (GGCT)/AIG2-like uncharacterized protein YtfP
VAVERLFIYGTLLPDLVRPPLDALVAKLTPIGAATVKGRLYDLGPYPGIVLDETAPQVRGELLALPEDPAILASLDDYEGSCHYCRVKCRAMAANGEVATCWVYECHADLSQADAIAHGDYRRWHTEKQMAAKG